MAAKATHPSNGSPGRVSLQMKYQRDARRRGAGDSRPRPDPALLRTHRREELRAPPRRPEEVRRAVTHPRGGQREGDGHRAGPGRSGHGAPPHTIREVVEEQRERKRKPRVGRSQHRHRNRGQRVSLGSAQPERKGQGGHAETDEQAEEERRGARVVGTRHGHERGRRRHGHAQPAQRADALRLREPIRLAGPQESEHREEGAQVPPPHVQEAEDRRNADRGDGDAGSEVLHGAETRPNRRSRRW